MVESLTQIQPKDYIKYGQDSTLMHLIQGETLLWADKVQKINMFGWNQTRMLILTDQALYNVHSKKVKRRIGLNIVSAITKTVTPSKNKEEFTVHVNSEYDYRFVTAK